MVVRKTLGLILAVLGIIGLAAWAIPEVKATIPQLGQFGDTPLLIVSVVVALIGVFLITKHSSRMKAEREVPIYHGKNIVGYRRH